MDRGRQILLLILLVSSYFITAPTAAQSDTKAIAIAQRVLDNMGGRQAWDNTRFLTWTYNNQHQIWDKHRHKFRLEEVDLVAIIDTETKEGKVYVGGQEVQDPEKAYRAKERAYAAWANNTYWLILPFRLLDPDVKLCYVGEDITMDGAEAYILEMSCNAGGLTPKGRYRLWIDKEKELVAQWALFKSQYDEKPIFIRRWTNYKSYGNIKLASDRSNLQSDFELFHIEAPASVPKKVFYNPTPVGKP